MSELTLPYPVCACGHRHDHHRHAPSDRCYMCSECEGYNPKAEALIAIINQLNLALAGERAVLAMAVARLGGTVEGAPTHRINFLQRIDELRRIEKMAEEDGLL